MTAATKESGQVENFDPRAFLAGDVMHAKRLRTDKFFKWICIAVATFCCSLLAFLMIAILVEGLGNLSAHFFVNPPDPEPAKAGFMPAIWGSVWLLFLTAAFALPIGVSAAIILEEYRPASGWMAKAHGLIQLNVTNLAGVPSVVYGIIGLTAFAHMFGIMSPSSVKPYVVSVVTEQVDVPAGVEVKPQTSFAAIGADKAAVTAIVVELEDAYGYDLDETASYETVGDLASALQDLENAAHKPYEVGVTYYYQYYNESEAVLIAPAPAMEDLPDYIEGPPAAGTMVKNAETGKMVEINIVGEDDEWPTDLALAARSVRSYDGGSRFSEKSWYYFSLPFGRGVLAGALTLMLVILPVIIIATQESLRAIPISLRQAAEGLGSTRWQTVWLVTLPAALPGIMTASIIAMSRAIGEAAPLLMIAGIVFITNAPQHIMSDFTAMPLQIYNWAGRPQEEFHYLAASGIIVLLTILLSFNFIAVFIRQKTQKKLS